MPVRHQFPARVPQFQDPGQYPPTAPVFRPDVPPPSNILPEGQSLVPTGSNSVYRFLDHLEATIVARGYYQNDQRIEWSGMEETFGAEADIMSRLRQRCGDFEFVLDSEFYINQPFDSDQLMNDAERQIVRRQFPSQPVPGLAIGVGDELRRLDVQDRQVRNSLRPHLLSALYQRGMGRAVHPHGSDRLRETGILGHYKSGYFVADLALTNGGDRPRHQLQQVPGGAGRPGVGLLGLGASAKKGNGNGSEWDKEFDNHYGVDLMFRSGPFQFSSEFVYDEYGFGRPGFDPLDITWVKSIYYRDVSSGHLGVPCTGVGYYVNLGYADGPWNALVNYGDYYPLYSGTAPDHACSIAASSRRPKGSLRRSKYSRS